MESRTNNLFPVPENGFGITGIYCPDGIQIPVEELRIFFDGPMRLVHEMVVADCAIPVAE